MTSSALVDDLATMIPNQPQSKYSRIGFSAEGI
jgi:hypothetical protein